MFKRYIHRHGKKLGPYYYENIRGHDGNVRTIYVGTNPHHHPKHRIRKPLFFIIVVLILILIAGSLLFVMQNKNYLIKKVKPQQSDFDVDQILLKVLVKSKESLEKEIRVMNTGSELASISIETSGLSDIVKIDAPSFAIKPGQTKIVTLNFYSFDEERRIEQQPGVYIGKLIVKSEKAAKEIPAVVEIETKNVPFDLNLNPVAFDRKVKQGTDTTIEVRLFNLESIESTNVDVDYFVKDINSNTIVTESETVVVKTQASFFKTISIPKNLKPGPYVFAAEARFGSSAGTASYLFEVVGPEEASFSQFCKNNVLCLGLSLTTILLMFALMAYFYFFIGAYLYEKFTGVVRLPKKREEKREKMEKAWEAEEAEETVAEKPGIIQKIKNKLDEWSEKRETAKAEKEKRKREEARKQEKKQKEIEKQKAEDEKTKREEELRQLAEERRKALEKKISRPSKKLQEFYMLMDEAYEALIGNDASKIDDLYKRERDLYIGLSNSEKQEVYDKLTELYKQQNKFLEIKKRHDETLKKEELRKQKELEKQKAEEEKIKKAEELITQKEAKARQKELEKQRQEQIKANQLEAISQVEAKLEGNKEAAELLNSKLTVLESEKEQLLNSISQLDAGVRNIEQKILDKAKNIEELKLQRNSLNENYKKQTAELYEKLEIQKTAQASKIKELKEKLEAKHSALTKALEEELSKLSLEKRKATEKWKRLELKAKLKIEEHALEEELKKYEGKGIDNKEIEQNYKKSLQEINKKQAGLKQEIEDLESHKGQILSEKIKISEDLRNKENKIQKIRLGIESRAREQQQLNAELSKLKAELKVGFFGDLISGIGKLQSKLEEKKRKIRQLGEQKRKQEELRKQEVLKKQKEIEKQKAEDEKTKREEELGKQPESERKKAKEERARKPEEEKVRKEEKKIIQEQKPSLFERLFKKERLALKEKPEEKLEKPKEKKPSIIGLPITEKITGKIPKEKVQEQKPSLFEGLFRRKPKFEFKKREKLPEEKAKSEIQKPTVFGRLFRTIVTEKPIEEKEKPSNAKARLSLTYLPETRSQLTEKKALTEAEELEDSIRELGLFKKLEKGELSIREEKKKADIFSKLIKKVTEKTTPQKKIKEQKPEKKIVVKSKKLDKFQKTFNAAKEAIGKNDIAKARKLYAEARNLYADLSTDETKEVYGELMELYNKLSGK